MNNPENTGAIRDEKGKFLKGQSGNPKGKPKGAISIVAKLKEKLEEVPPDQQKTYLELIVDILIEKAIDRKDKDVLRDIIDRIDGKPKQTTDLNVNKEETEEALKALKEYLDAHKPEAIQDK